MSIALGRGTSGGRGLYELLTVDETYQPLIQKRANASLIRKATHEYRLTFWVNDGLVKITAGKITPAEVLLVAQQG